MKTYDNFSEAYVDIVKDVVLYPEFTSSPRGMKVKEILGYQFRLTNPRHRIPYVKGRDLSIHYMIAELLWYLSGNNSTEWISNYSSFWNKISDDGKTANSAYGSRIFSNHRYQRTDSDDSTLTQWEYVKNELKIDNDSRRAVIHIRMPQDSINAKLDVPCTLTLQFLLRRDKVHMITSMRSSDVILGLAYDVPAFTFFQELLAFQLSKDLGRPIGLGDYIHTSASLHIYERHFEMAKRIVEDDYKNDYESLLEMPIISDDIPVENLISVEKKIRESYSRDSLLKICYDFASEHQRWKDWCYILASHRVLKTGDVNLSNELLLDCDFKGYKFFQRS